MNVQISRQVCRKEDIYEEGGKMTQVKIGDKVKIIRSHRGDFEGMVGELVEIKAERKEGDLKYRVLVTENFDLWASKVEKV